MENGLAISIIAALALLPLDFISISFFPLGHLARNHIMQMCCLSHLLISELPSNIGGLQWASGGLSLAGQQSRAYRGSRGSLPLALGEPAERRRRQVVNVVNIH